MAYHQNHFHKFILVSGVFLGLLVTGGYNAAANSSDFNSISDDFNSTHATITFNHRFANRQAASAKNNQKRSTSSESKAQDSKQLLPSQTVSKYHRILNGMNHYYNRAKIAKPKEIASSHRYVKKNLPSLNSDSRNAQSSNRASTEKRDRSASKSVAEPNSHLVISFSNPDYPMKAETAHDRADNANSFENQKSTQLNDGASNVNNQVGDWFRDGLNESELNARNWISWRESNDRWDVLSYSSRCIGYFQLSPRYLGYVNGHLNLDHQHQVQAADHYAKSKYGSWSAAKQFWLNHRWY